jgi:hypothetical protein
MRLRSVLAVIAASSILGCGGGATDASTPATPGVFLDAATTAAAVTTSDVARMVSPSGASLLASPGNPDPTLGCAFTAGHFVCSVQFAGLSGTTTVTLFAANGSAETAYDSLATASVHFDTDVSGLTSVGPWDAVVGRHRRLVESGLAGVETTRTWNGSGMDTLQVIDSTGGLPARSYTIFSTVTVTNVVVPAPGSGAPWPAVGTITQRLVLAATSGESSGLTFRLEATVTFNGTARVVLLVGNHSFTLDLSTGVATETG